MNAAWAVAIGTVFMGGCLTGVGFLIKTLVGMFIDKQNDLVKEQKKTNAHLATLNQTVWTVNNRVRDLEDMHDVPHNRHNHSTRT